MKRNSVRQNGAAASLQKIRVAACFVGPDRWAAWAAAEMRERCLKMLVSLHEGDRKMSDEEGVAAVERALSILDALGGEKVTLAELSARTGLYKSTLLRLCKSLERFQYVYRQDDGAFRLGSKLMALGFAYQRSFKTSEVVTPVLQQIVEALCEGASFYVGDGDSRVCLHRVDAARAVRDSVHEGDRLPISVGAAAHVIRAFSDARGAKFDRIRNDMYAMSIGERDPETAAVACPVFGVDQKFIGALSVSGPRYRIESMGAERIVPVLFKNARALTRTLGGDCDAPAFARWAEPQATVLKKSRSK